MFHHVIRSHDRKVAINYYIMPHPQTWRLSQDASKASGECSVCHAVRQLHLKDGTVHQHGSRNNRCPGSGKPPAVSYLPPEPTVIQTQHQAAQQQQQSTLGHPSLSGNIIKHIPRSTRTPLCSAVNYHYQRGHCSARRCHRVVSTAELRREVTTRPAKIWS